MPDNNLNKWKITGIVATFMIILGIPFYVLKENHVQRDSGNTPLGRSTFVGSDKCGECHKPEYNKWKGSHHERAMDVANDKTVRGNFDNAVFEHQGVTSRFYRKQEKFFIHTQGPEGNMGDFEITHTFGWFPLQQYLIPFPNGRLQCLPIAWDERDGKWFHLYPNQRLEPSDWLYWTNNGQNWNGMCAECHSTDLRKNFNPDNGSYDTRWAEISVGCEACHGPGSAHVKWAELPEMGRPEADNAALEVRTRQMTSRQQIQLCAPCHSRRMSLGDNIHRHADFLDYGVPQLLTEGYYFPDGQILDEVYVYGSFMQSKMHQRDVRCSDCHDVHSIKRVKEGNDLCLQCHRAAVYDTGKHHFHKKKGENGEPITDRSGEVLFEVGTGARCEQCHMPGRTYMGVDYRPDHSFRIPQPELTSATGSPNACNRCHIDKSVQWSMDTITKWYGQRKRLHYGTILADGRQGRPSAQKDLVNLVDDRLYPTIVRATALSMLAAYPGEVRRETFQRALSDEEALMRYTAVRNFPQEPASEILKRVGPLLYDPVKAVRSETAARLVGLKNNMSAELQARHRAALNEYIQATLRMGDFATARHNLGNLYSRQGETEQAVQQYRKAITIDDLFYPAKVNLATILNQKGKNDEAERLLREVVAGEPDLHDVKYSLGLLLAEVKKFEDAVVYMSQAARGLPDRDRIHYNLGLLRQHLGQDSQAETELKRALELMPDSSEYLYALAVFYLQRQRLREAEALAVQLMQKPESHAMGQEMMQVIEQAESASGRSSPYRK